MLDCVIDVDKWAIRFLALASLAMHGAQRDWLMWLSGTR